LAPFRKTSLTPANNIFGKTLGFFVPPVLSGILLILSLPPYDLGWLSWIGLVPLLIAVYGRTVIYAFFLAFIFGLTFFSGVFYWTLAVDSYSFLHQIVLILYLGSYFGLFGFVFSFLTKKYSLTVSLFLVPFIWVSLEYLRSNMGFLAHPWPLLGHAQGNYLPIIQMADFSGTYGVSFLVGMINSVVAAMCFFLLYKSKKSFLPTGFRISIRGLGILGVTAFCLVGFTLFYGVVKLSKPIEGKKLRISIVQGNITQEHKWNPKYAKAITEIYTDLTRKVMKEKPDLIVWPEAATPKPVNLDKSLYRQVTQLSEEANAYLLVGSSSHEKFKSQEREKIKLRNSAFLFNPDKTINDQRYDKIHLLPFGEYLPYKEIIPWSWINIPNVVTTIAGNMFTVFECPGFRFSAPICWETVFPYVVRNFVRNGAQFIVNITNEAWFGDTAAPYHFLSSNVFRAVENRVYLVRCGNTGVSCFIDPHGRIVNRVKDETGRDIFVRGTLTETITLMNTQTIYTRFGDLFAWLCIGCSVLFLIAGIFREGRTLQFK
jgi:apolipoprotein N-acyltransferase